MIFVGPEIATGTKKLPIAFEGAFERTAPIIKENWDILAPRCLKELLQKMNACLHCKLSQ